MGYSINATESGCYPASTVLINKLGIRSQTELDEAERIAVTFRSVELETTPPKSLLTFADYSALHRTLFSDLYDWAGTLRTIDLSKKGTYFCPAIQLPEISGSLFARLQAADGFNGLPQEDFSAAIAEFYHDLNMLHPFREGNGRTQRLFFTLLIRRAGYDIDFAQQDTDLLMIATILAAQGIMDHLIAFFAQAIHRKEN